MENKDTQNTEVTLDIDNLEIQELEEREAPFEWACLTSTSCKCTSTSCAGWSV